MPRLLSAVPRYRKHRQSGQAIVSLNGRDHLLGPHGTKTSKNAYDRLVSEWLANGRQAPAVGKRCSISVAHVMAAYLSFAKGYYVKHGRPTREFELVREACRFIRPLYARTEASEFGPLALKVVRQKMIDAGHCRNHVNKNISRVKRMFNWAAERELIPGNVVVLPDNGPTGREHAEDVAAADEEAMSG